MTVLKLVHESKHTWLHWRCSGLFCWTM